MNRINLILLVILVASYSVSSAQIRHGGHPKSFLLFPSDKKAQGNNLKENIPVVRMETFDEHEFIKEHSPKGKKGGAIIGKVIDVDINILTKAKSTDVDGGKIYQLQIESLGAEAIGLFFSNYKLTEGCEVYVYPPDRSYFLGAYTEKNNKKGRAFAIQPVKGDKLTIELWVPYFSENPELILDGVGHKIINEETNHNSDSCLTDINCEAGENWQTEKRAVVKYAYRMGSGWFPCSGALINNTAHNGKPYLLTARHCIDENSNLETMIFYYGYEKQTCESYAILADDFTTTGANLLATGKNEVKRNEQVDFTLLELIEEPQEEYRPYYAGWDRSANTPYNITLIHHPAGDVKKISKSDDVIKTRVKPERHAGWPDVDGSYLEIDWKFGLGYAQGGSSGSPVFNEDHLIVANLTGGEISTCENKLKDCATSFDYCWDYLPSTNTSLKKWLDPINTGQMTLEGYDPYGQTTPPPVEEEAGLLKKKKTLPEGYKLVFTDGSPLQIDLIDITGRVLAEWEEINSLSPFNLSMTQFKYGVYILRMRRDGITHLEKIVHYQRSN